MAETDIENNTITLDRETAATLFEQAVEALEEYDHIRKECYFGAVDYMSGVLQEVRYFLYKALSEKE